MLHSKIGDWFGRHRKTKIALISLAAILSLQTALTVNGLLAQAETVETPKYQIVNTKQSVGITGLDEYYVKIDPLDLSNAGFKDKVKQVITAIGNEKGTADFMANIFTESDVLAFEHNATGYYNDLVEVGVVTTDRMQWTREMVQKSDTAFVASYTGGFDYTSNPPAPSKADSAYNILWFGTTDTNHPVVGQYMGDEKWKPNVETSEDSESEGCFIATATYGTETAQDVDSLRGFRDNHLKTNSTGKAFVDFYYYKAPAAADYIADKPVLRAYVRENYVKPAVAVVEFFGLNK